MRWNLSIICFLLSSFIFGQESLQWTKRWSVAAETNSNWRVNALGNLLISEKDELKKIDSLGVQTFQQSTKSFGEIRLIDPMNPMKTLIFSQEQQLVGYLDNTLTLQQATIDLANFDFSYVTYVCASIQPDKFWVFDQDNAIVSLVGNNKQQIQQIVNVSGLLGLNDIIQIREYNNFFYLIDAKKGVFQFDNFGTLLFKWERSNIDWVEFESNFIYILANNELEVLQQNNIDSQKISLPEKDVIQFQKLGKTIYLRTKKEIIRYEVEINQN